MSTAATITIRQTAKNSGEYVAREIARRNGKVISSAEVCRGTLAQCRKYRAAYRAARAQ